MYPFLENLHFDLKLNICFGVGKVAALPIYLNEKGWTNVLIITDSGLLESDLLSPIINQLNCHNIKVNVFDQVEPNPKDTIITEAKEMAVKKGVQAVIGVGGGSSMDTAKAVGVLVTNGGVIQSYDGVDKVPINPLPIVTIPTTAGTGSEVTANAAITCTKTNYKMSIRTSKIIPNLSILDPELLRTIPPTICSTSSVDALTHALEGYLSKRSTTFTDLVSLQAIEILAANIKPFYANPSNTEVAANMLYGSMLAGIVITNTGTGNAHALARALGGEFDIPHGYACALFLPRVLKFNGISSPLKYKNIAKALWLINDGSSLTQEKIVKHVVDHIENLLESLSIPKYLEDLDISPSSFNQLANIALKNTAPNPRDTSYKDLLNILNESYSFHSRETAMSEK